MARTASASLAALLKYYRAASGQTQEELAERAGLSVRSISDMERGVAHRPQAYTVVRLVQALGLEGEEASRFQLAARQSQSTTPDPRVGVASPLSLDGDPLRAPGTLPVSPTPFIGRQREIREVSHLVRQVDARLLTLTGPGGTGKTRLALRVAEEVGDAFPDGVYFVSLASLLDPELVPVTLATALGVTEVSGQLILSTLTTHLRRMRVLLVVDNFEHLLPAAMVLSDLLVVCPFVVVLVTSRAVLHLAAEREYPVPPLPVPLPHHLPEVDALARYDAVQLFIHRAAAIKPNFALTEENAAAIAEICYRLDGLPLALELAAARIRLFPPQALLARLQSRLDFLIGGPQDQPARQQTLRAAIEWSDTLLSEGERALFTRLSAFVGGCTLDAAEAVRGTDLEIEVLDGIASLLDKSLVQQAGELEPRFSMLETIREYAQEKLIQQGHNERTRDAHALFFLELSEAAQRALKGPQQGEWLARLDLELGNIRSALRWLLDRAETEKALQLASALYRYWLSRDYLREGRSWLESGLERADGVNPATRAEATWTAGWLAIEQWDHTRAMALQNEALSLFQELGHGEGTVRALLGLKYIHTWQGDYDQAARLATESLRRSQEIDYPEGVAWSLLSFGVLASFQGNLDQARDHSEEALRLFRALGDSERVAGLLNNLAYNAQQRGKLDEAVRWCDEGLALSRTLRSGMVSPFLLATSGTIARRQGNYDRADQLFREAILLARRAGAPALAVGILGQQAEVAEALGDGERAVRLWGAETILRERLSLPILEVFRNGEEEPLIQARARVGEEFFTRAWEEGRAMSLEEATAYALGESG